jgi:hypothetical protein
MAVIQISKIQVRRGRELTNSGIPQLSSGEFAWTVDTQRLFIGNGSVSEGAPYVGNTEILTENSNILEIASGYQFAQGDPSVPTAVTRSLQSKLDEIQVSVLDFGAIPDGITNNSVFFENAFKNLFANTDSRYKKVLIVPNGVYKFTSDLRIPKNVILKGETQSGVILDIGSNNIKLAITTLVNNELDFITGLDQFDSTNRPENLHISNLTIKRTSGRFIISGAINSTFERLIVKGEYDLGDSVSDISDEPSAIYWEHQIEGTAVTNVKFYSCIFENNSIGIKSKLIPPFPIEPADYDTEILISDSRFFTVFIGICIEAIEEIGNHWQINDCEFESTFSSAIRSSNYVGGPGGRSTIIQRCKFTRCANGGDDSDNPKEPIIYFGESIGNLVIDSNSDRIQRSNIASLSTQLSVVEVKQGDKSIFINRAHSLIIKSDSPTTLAVFSADNRYYNINYFLRLGNYSRVGRLTLSINNILSMVDVNQLDEPVAITDEYQYSPSLESTPGASILNSFEFFADLRDNTKPIGDSVADTIVLSYKNPISSLGDGSNDGVEGSISFDITYGV